MKTALVSIFLLVSVATASWAAACLPIVNNAPTVDGVVIGGDIGRPNTIKIPSGCPTTTPDIGWAGVTGRGVDQAAPPQVADPAGPTLFFAAHQNQSDGKVDKIYVAVHVEKAPDFTTNDRLTIYFQADAGKGDWDAKDFALVFDAIGPGAATPSNDGCSSPNVPRFYTRAPDNSRWAPQGTVPAGIAYKASYAYDQANDPQFPLWELEIGVDVSSTGLNLNLVKGGRIGLGAKLYLFEAGAQITTAYHYPGPITDPKDLTPIADSGIDLLPNQGGVTPATLDKVTVGSCTLDVWTQQDEKLVGSGAVGAAQQGGRVALSADGATAIVGGPGDNGGVGAAWVFTRSGGVWTQQGEKLVGSGAAGAAEQGFSVALSADGATAIVGGPGDNGGVGAAWVFTRSGGVWTQQGQKLVGSGAVGRAFQGFSVALSADGATAIVGGAGDNYLPVGAAWVFTRSGGVWAQQGQKLVGSGAVGGAFQGDSVALSADGATAIVGGSLDKRSVGAAWVFTRSGGVWTQQGEKLVGSGAVGAAAQGESVALSADGATAIVGGYGDNGSVGAAWAFTRSGGVWTQHGEKLAGSGAVGAARQGDSVVLSADGATAIVGGSTDKGNFGAAWVFTRSGGVWTQQGQKLVGSGAVGAARQGLSIALSADGATAIVGGPWDNGAVGAAWVFTRSGIHPSGGL